MSINITTTVEELGKHTLKNTNKYAPATMITLIGTGHVFDLSSALIDIFDEHQPDVIGIELDHQRYQAILAKQQHPDQPRQVSKELPLIYKMLAKFQDSMASEYGVQAGDEMMTAISYGQSHSIPVAFIDMNAQVLFQKMWKTMPIREKFRLMFSGVSGLFVSKKRVEKELQNIQDDFDYYIQEIGKKFPTIKTTLIDKRNDYMVAKLLNLAKTHEKIFACIGDGHIPGISDLLAAQQIDFTTIRLAELRNRTPRVTDGSQGGFSITYSPG